MTITFEEFTEFVRRHHNLQEELIFAVSFDLEGYTLHRYKTRDGRPYLEERERVDGLDYWERFPASESVRHIFPEHDLLTKEIASVFQ